jgi:hypothetical protein
MTKSVVRKPDDIDGDLAAGRRAIAERAVDV